MTLSFLCAAFVKSGKDSQSLQRFNSQSQYLLHLKAGTSVGQQSLPFQVAETQLSLSHTKAVDYDRMVSAGYRGKGSQSVGAEG